MGASDLFLLGLLNSRVVDFYMHSISATRQGGYYEYKPMYVSQLPIRSVNKENVRERHLHDEIVNAVRRILDVKIQLSASRTDRDKSLFRAKCDVLDRQIDEAVFELYGITREERTSIAGM